MTCLLLSTAGAAIIALSSYLGQVNHFPGMRMIDQGLVGIAIGCAMAALSYIGYRLQRQQPHIRDTIASYSRLDLRGMNPVWISLAAGFGEELLFRAALQPLLGPWLASAVFVLAHARAYRFWPLNKAAWIKILALSGSSLFFGLVFAHIGLLAAMLSHAMIDMAALLTIKKLKQRMNAENLATIA